MNSPEWLKPIDAARRLDISTKELYRLIDEGALPAYRFGRVIRLLAADVEAYRSGGDDR
jgi:excisionase family DNA binding protein